MAGQHRAGRQLPGELHGDGLGGGGYRIRELAGGNVCAVDPDVSVVEANEANNTCTDTVSVAVPDLTVTKTNSVSGSGTARLAVDLDLTVANSNVAGTGAATFAVATASVARQPPEREHWLWPADGLEPDRHHRPGHHHLRDRQQ